MANDESVNVSLKKKISLYEKYLLIARMAEKYSNDKKVLKALKKISAKELKSLKASRYPMESEDLQDATLLISELCDVLKSLIKASDHDRYRLASAGLTDFLGKLEKECRKANDILQPKPTARDILDAALGKAKSIGGAIEKGVEEIKKNGKRPRLKIGIVFSGGLSKCAYQIGFCKSLLKYVEREEIVALSGASMGTLVAYAFSTNKLAVLEQMYRRVDISKKIELLHEVFMRGLLRKTLEEFECLEDELEIPMAFPVCRVPIFSVRYFWLAGRYNPCWDRYMRAAMNFPFLCVVPEVLGHRFAIDGGAADNIPLFPLLKQERRFFSEEETFDLILVLHFDARYDYRRDFTTDVPILDLDLGICNNFKKNHYDFSAEYVDEMISHAEAYGDDICRELFSGECSKEELQRKIDVIFLREHMARQKNLSADHFVSLLNTVGRFLRSDGSCNEFLY